MHKFILSLCLLCSVIHSVAQVSGYVFAADNGEPLQGIIVKATVAEKTVAFAFTNANGQYHLKVDTLRSGMQLSASGMGFATATQNITTLGSQPDVRMQTQDFEIEEISVEAPPMQAVGDTIVYNVNAFATKADQTLEDVLKHLPGIDVQPNGQIRYNGEPINKFYIEGLDLLGGKYAIATRNINPNDIASVSVYENHQPKRVLRNVEPSDKAALNIKLKHNRMLRPIGYALSGEGYGDDEMKYRGEMFIMGIAPKNQFITTGKTNNFGLSYETETSFLLEDVFDNSTLASDIFPLTPCGTASISTSRYFANKSGSTSVNTIHKIAPVQTLSVQATYNREHNKYANNTETDYYISDNDTISISEKCRSELLRNNVNAKIKLENNADSFYVTNELRIDGHWNENNYSVYTDSLINNWLNSKDLGVDNTFNMIIKNGGNIYEIKSVVGLASTPKNGIEAATMGIPFVVQNVEGTTFHTINEISTSWLMGRYFIFGSKLAIDVRRDEFTSENIISQNDNSGIKLGATAEPYLQLQKNAILWRTTIPLNMHIVSFDDNQTKSKYNKKLFLPDVISTLRIAQGITKTNFTIGRKNRVGDLTNLIINPIYTTYRRQQTLGSGMLRQQTENYLSVATNFRNAVEGIVGSVRVRLSQIENNQTSASVVSTNQTQTTSASVKSKGRRLMSMFNISKNLIPLNTVVSIDGNGAIVKQKMMRQGVMLDAQNKTFTVDANAQGSWINNLISLRIECSLMGTESSSDIAASSTLLRRAIMADMSVVPMQSLQITAHAEADKADVTNSDVQKSFFLDCGIRYVRSKFDVGLIARNLLNCSTYSYSLFNDFDTYTYSYTLRPIEFMLVLKWSF